MSAHSRVLQLANDRFSAVDPELLSLSLEQLQSLRSQLQADDLFGPALTQERVIGGPFADEMHRIEARIKQLGGSLT